MLILEYSLSVLGQLLCIAVSVWVLVKINKLAGVFLVFGFSLTFLQMLVIKQMSDVVKFDFPESGEPTMFNSGLIVPVWYQVLLIARTVSQFGIPVGIYMAAKTHYERNT